MSMLMVVALTVFWATGVVAIACASYGWGYTRGQLFQIQHAAPAPVPQSGLTKKEVVSLLAALEKIVDFAAEMSPVKNLAANKPVHH